MEQYTAVGIKSEPELFIFSRSVGSECDPQKVADFLAKEAGFYFEEILLMKNGTNGGPEVFQHWVIGKDFDG